MTLTRSDYVVCDDMALSKEDTRKKVFWQQQTINVIQEVKCTWPREVSSDVAEVPSQQRLEKQFARSIMGLVTLRMS